MAKSEQGPPLRMKVENGHLTPSSAWDAERLSSYRNGADVNVFVTQEVASWRRRKYWAVLGKVVKTCPVRQTRAEDLHKAIRLKLGIVESFTTIGGATKVELRSTSLMDEQEFEAYYLEAMDLLREVTGVDVETLGKESADVGHDETEQPEVPVNPSSGSGSGGDAPHDAAPDPTAAADPAPEETAAPPAEPSGADTPDEPASLIAFAKRIVAVIGADTDFLLAEGTLLVDELGITTKAMRDKARSITKYAARACDDYQKPDKMERKVAINMIAGVAGCDAKDLT